MLTVDYILEHRKESIIDVMDRIRALTILELFDDPQFKLIRRAWRIQIPNLLRVVNDDADVKEEVCIEHLLEIIDKDVQA